MAVAARVLPKELAAKVLRIIAAVPYDDAVTCVVQVPKKAEQECSNAVVGDEVFFGPREPPEEQPFWVQRREGDGFQHLP